MLFPHLLQYKYVLSTTDTLLLLLLILLCRFNVADVNLLLPFDIPKYNGLKTYPLTDLVLY